MIIPFALSILTMRSGMSVSRSRSNQQNCKDEIAATRPCQYAAAATRISYLKRLTFRGGGKHTTKVSAANFTDFSSSKSGFQ